MENQHRQIAGYRELEQHEIDLMNRVKKAGQEIGNLVKDLEAMRLLDQRWIAIGKTHMQQGLMALTRGVTKPEFF